ncbi:MAG: hypothetical protein IPL08_16290 [Saprospiraceae bacterium]|nr:hypothetical protein [Saprospiraceae bacterium]
MKSRTDKDANLLAVSPAFMHPYHHHTSIPWSQSCTNGIHFGKDKGIYNVLIGAPTQTLM